MENRGSFIYALGLLFNSVLLAVGWIPPCGPTSVTKLGSSESLFVVFIYLPFSFSFLYPGKA